MIRLNRIEYALIVTFASLLVFPVLYILRFLDDNTLTSWKWVFRNISPAGIYATVFFSIAVAFVISRVSIPKKLFAPLSLILPFLIVMPIWSGPEVILDSSRYFVQAKFLELKGISYFLSEWGRDINAWTDLPAVPFVYGLIFKYIGESRVFIQLLNSTVFSLCAFTTYLLGKDLWDAETGFYSGLFLAGIPYLLVQVPLMMVDVATMFLMVLSVFSFARAVRDGGFVNILFSATIIFIAMLSKYSTWLMFFVLPVISFVFLKDSARDVVSRSLKVISATGTLCSVILIFKYDLFLRQVSILRTYQWPALSNWSEGFISTFFFQSHPFIIALAFLGIYQAIVKKDRRFLIPVWFTVFIVILRVERIRYIIPLLPLFTLMASYGLRNIRFEEMRRFVVLSVMSLSLVTVYIGYAPFLKTTSMANLQYAGRYLDDLDSPAVNVRTLPQIASSGNTDIVVPILDIYTSKKIFFDKENSMQITNKVPAGSPLRFTWEFGMPDFYSDMNHDETLPYIIISSEKDTVSILQGISSDFTPMKDFELSSEVFRFRSFVYVIAGNPLSGSGQ